MGDYYDMISPNNTIVGIIGIVEKEENALKKVLRCLYAQPYYDSCNLDISHQGSFLSFDPL